MRFKIDENMPAEIAQDLRSLGHDATTVIDQGMTGVDDELLMARFEAEARNFMTMDRGIAKTQAYLPDRLAGLILLRPNRVGRGAVLPFARKETRATAGSRDARSSIRCEQSRNWPPMRYGYCRRVRCCRRMNVSWEPTSTCSTDPNTEWHTIIGRSHCEFVGNVFRKESRWLETCPLSHPLDRMLTGRQRP